MVIKIASQDVYYFLKNWGRQKGPTNFYFVLGSLTATPFGESGLESSVPARWESRLGASPAWVADP